MIKKIILISMFLFFVATPSWGTDDSTAIYPVEPPTTERHIEQIKWAYNQGYMYGVLASYGIFMPVNYQENFVLPVIKTAWEKGYVDGVIHVYEISK